MYAGYLISYSYDISLSGVPPLGIVELLGTRDRGYSALADNFGIVIESIFLKEGLLEALGIGVGSLPRSS